MPGREARRSCRGRRSAGRREAPPRSPSPTRRSASSIRASIVRCARSWPSRMPRPVALLVLGLAVHVVLLRLLEREEVGRVRRVQHRGGHEEPGEGGVALARLLGLGLQRGEGGEHVAVLLLARGVGRDPRREVLLVLLLLREDAALHEALELALAVGERVVEAAQRAPAALIFSSGSVFPSASRIAICSCAVLTNRGKRPLGRLLHLGVGLVALRAAGVADDEDEVALLRRPRAAPAASAPACRARSPSRSSPACRPCRRRRGRRTSRRCAAASASCRSRRRSCRCRRPGRRRGARPGSRAARSRSTSGRRRRTSRGSGARPPRRPPTRSLIAPLDEVEALAVVELRVDLPGDRVGHLLDGDGDEHARAGAVRELLLARLREEAVHEQVLLRGRVVLERRPCTQWWFVAIRPSGETNEAVQPPSETIAPMGWPVRSAKAAGSPSKPIAFSFCGEVGDLLRHPHPLVGGEGQRRRRARRASGEEAERRSSWRALLDASARAGGTRQG